MMQVLLFLSLFICGSVYAARDEPPEPWKSALMCRYVMHHTDWLGVATLSAQPAIKGYPFVSVISVSDGPEGNSTGIPYMYISDHDTPPQDVPIDNRVSIMATLAQTDFCSSKEWDQEDPRCGRLYITGRMIVVENTTEEFKVGREYVYSRHPAMRDWPTDHDFHLWKLDMELIQIFDSFGGPISVTPAEYYNPAVTAYLNAGSKSLFNEMKKRKSA